MRSGESDYSSKNNVTEINLNDMVNLVAKMTNPQGKGNKMKFGS